MHRLARVGELARAALSTEGLPEAVLDLRGTTWRRNPLGYVSASRPGVVLLAGRVRFAVAGDFAPVL